MVPNLWVMTSDVNHAELFDAEPRLLVIDDEPRLSFSEEKKTSPSRTETLAKQVLPS